MKMLWGMTLWLMAAMNAQGEESVNCGQVLRDAQIPACIVMEDAPKYGCGKDLLIKQGERWAGKAQTKDAQTQTAQSAQECLDIHSRTAPKDRCCRRDLEKPKPKAAAPKTRVKAPFPPRKK